MILSEFETGDFIAADAKIIEGTAGTDQSAITGESMLISKKQVT